MEDEGFDKKEWLEENGVKEGKTWIPLRGGKPKIEYCDIKLKDDKVFGPCWPAQSGLMFVDLSSENEDRHPLSTVSEVRYYIEDDGSKDEDDGEDEEEPEET